MTPFCPACSTYCPAGAVCPNCQVARAPLVTPVAPGQPLWQYDLPGPLAARMALAQVGGQWILVGAWSTGASREDRRPSAGGLFALRLNDGAETASLALDLPVEGGVAVDGTMALVGSGRRDRGPGAVTAFDLAENRLLWRTGVGGAVRGAPTLADSRVYVTADDGKLYALDQYTGAIPERWPIPASPEPVTMAASPVLVQRRGAIEGIITGSYGARWQSGALRQFDVVGRLRADEQPVHGNVRGTPVLAGGVLYVTSYHRDGSGAVMAFDAHTLQPAWSKPFLVKPKRQEAKAYFSAPPLVQQGIVYAGSLDHEIYALDAATGQLRWQFTAGGSIATQPAWVQGLIVFGANDGNVYAVDAASRQQVWRFDLGAEALTHPLVWANGVVLAAARNGRLAALPWHLGRYDWAAERLQAAGQYDDAGDCWALAAENAALPATQDAHYRRAAEAWMQAGRPGKVARLSHALGRQTEAAAMYLRAGRHWQMRDRNRAAAYFQAAAELYLRLQRTELNECTALLAQCAGLPLLDVSSRNLGSYVQGKEGHLTLRIKNDSKFLLPDGLTLWVGGSLQREVEARIYEEMTPGQMWNVPLALTPTKPQDELLVEYRYATGRFDIPALYGLLRIPITARAAPIQIGDVGAVNVTIAAQTDEGLAIVTEAVGVIKAAGDIEHVDVQGDAGAIIAREGDIGSVVAGGDVMLARSSSKMAS